jgi:hypothetical protein
VAESAAYEGLILKADLSAATAEDSIAVDLRIASKDANGFTVDQVVSPAFTVGNWDTTATDVKLRRIMKSYRFALNQNFPSIQSATRSVISFQHSAG